MENYYEILEISQNASKEIIDKAYRTLAKKYHPDANPEDKKKWAEEKFKKINEAYEVISDTQKRKDYDIRLAKEKEMLLSDNQNLKDKYEEICKQNKILKSRLENLNINKPNNSYIPNNNENENYINIQDEINRKVAQSVNKAYHDAYIQRMRSYGYRIHYKKSFKEKLRDILSILIATIVVIAVLCIIWQIPDVRNHIESNKIFQVFKDSFLK